MSKIFFGFVVVLTFFTAIPQVRADESYQIHNIVGLWKTLDYPFATTELQINLADDGKALELTYCALGTEFSGECKKSFEYTGVGTYSVTLDGIDVVEGPHSPTPNYKLKVNDKNAQRLSRTWGNQTIGYFRLK
jgi:hypothetical protein